jgi:hypothetical protein
MPKGTARRPIENWNSSTLVTNRAGDDQRICPNYDRKTTNFCQERLPSAMKNTAVNFGLGGVYFQT